MKLRFHHERMADDLALLDAVQGAAPDLTLMVDANQATFLPSPEPSPRWDYRRALQTARELEARGVLWLEEPLAKFDFDSLARLRQETAIHIAGGESNRELHEFRWLIERGVYDIVQPDCALSEGISQMRKIAALAEAFQRACIPHHGLSGLGLAATLHLVCTLPGMVWLEMMYEPPTRTVETYQRLGGILETSIWLDGEGYVTPPAAPGLGVERGDVVHPALDQPPELVELAVRLAPRDVDRGLLPQAGQVVEVELRERLLEPEHAATLQLARRRQGAPVVPVGRRHRRGQERRLVRVHHQGQVGRRRLHRVQQRQVVGHPLVVEAELHRPEALRAIAPGQLGAVGRRAQLRGA
ncbi:MAG TPA: enolase C-terminal domain-like protein, partial [Solirubrobacterales bacterium]|nr:enolase C-terminal domain-like protein [Solirubrobacterales bacterium]